MASAPSSQLLTLSAALLLTSAFYCSGTSLTPRFPVLTGPAGFVNLLDIADPAYPQHAVTRESSRSISGRTSGINPKDHPTITTRGVAHGTGLKKRIQERASFVRCMDSKQVATVGMEAFHEDPNIPEEKEAIHELGKGAADGGGRMNVAIEKYYKQFPQMHRLGRR